MNTTSRGDWFIISLLGALSAISPFAIDMYLPAFTHMAKDLHTTSAVVSFSLSAYLIGLALGQVFYGPLLDRFGRKKPIYIGLGIFVLASIACAFAPTIEVLIACRVVQALAGCGAQVGAVAMVRDFFPVKDSAKVYSLIFLFIGVSPLLAPSVGSLLMLYFGWHAIFLLLALLVAILLAMMALYLPEGHGPDPTISLRPATILSHFIMIMKQPQFRTYAMAGSFSMAGLFAYVAGSPIIFMEGFQLNEQQYGSVFAILTLGFIGGSQLNVWLLRYYSSELLFLRVSIIQVIVSAVFLAGTALHWYGFYETLVLFFVFLACTGLIFPNGAALALEPFTKNAGSASALIGFLRMGIGSLMTVGIGMFGVSQSLPIILILCVTATIGLAILLLTRRSFVLHVAHAPAGETL